MARAKERVVGRVTPSASGVGAEAHPGGGCLCVVPVLCGHDKTQQPQVRTDKGVVPGWTGLVASESTPLGVSFSVFPLCSGTSHSAPHPSLGPLPHVGVHTLTYSTYSRVHTCTDSRRYTQVHTFMGEQTYTDTSVWTDTHTRTHTDPDTPVCTRTLTHGHTGGTHRHTLARVGYQGSLWTRGRPVRERVWVSRPVRERLGVPPGVRVCLGVPVDRTDPCSDGDPPSLPGWSVRTGSSWCPHSVSARVCTTRPVPVRSPRRRQGGLNRDGRAGLRGSWGTRHPSTVGRGPSGGSLSLPRPLDRIFGDSSRPSPTRPLEPQPPSPPLVDLSLIRTL